MVSERSIFEGDAGVNGWIVVGFWLVGLVMGFVIGFVLGGDK